MHRFWEGSYEVASRCTGNCFVLTRQAEVAKEVPTLVVVRDFDVRDFARQTGRECSTRPSQGLRLR